MKNTIAILALIMINILNIGCVQNSSVEVGNEAIYQEYKRDFDKRFVDHFPAKRTLSVSNTTAYSSRDEQKMTLA